MSTNQISSILTSGQPTGTDHIAHDQNKEGKENELLKLHQLERRMVATFRPESPSLGSIGDGKIDLDKAVGKFRFNARRVYSRAPSILLLERSCG